MGDDKELYPKSKFLMCITTLRRVEVQDPNDEEKTTWQYQVLGSKWIKSNGKEFRESIYESRGGGENIKIEIVNQKPEKFKINQIYMLPTRDRVWVWIEE